MPKLRSLFALLAAVVVVSSPALAQNVVFSETFDSDAGQMQIANGADPAAGWAFDAGCPPAASAPNGAGVLRWGTFSDCFTYGALGHQDSAATPATDLTAGCNLTFNYHLDYEEPVSFENADVEVSVDGSSAPLLSLANGTLSSNAAWVPSGPTDLPEGSVSVSFIGTTDDGAFNSGTGWSIDDVTITCPGGGTPATSGWGLVALMMGISMAMAVALFRLRKQSVRG